MAQATGQRAVEWTPTNQPTTHRKSANKKSLRLWRFCLSALVSRRCVPPNERTANGRGGQWPPQGNIATKRERDKAIGQGERERATKPLRRERTVGRPRQKTMRNRYMPSSSSHSSPPIGGDYMVFWRALGWPWVRKSKKSSHVFEKFQNWSKEWPKGIKLKKMDLKCTKNGFEKCENGLKMSKTGSKIRKSGLSSMKWSESIYVKLG